MSEEALVEMRRTRRNYDDILRLCVLPRLLRQCFVLKASLSDLLFYLTSQLYHSVKIWHVLLEGSGYDLETTTVITDCTAVAPNMLQFHQALRVVQMD